MALPTFVKKKQRKREKSPHSQGWNASWGSSKIENTPSVTSWPVSSSDVYCCNTMAHYLEPHSHIQWGQFQTIRLVELDPFSTLKQLPFSLNQSKWWVGRMCNVKPGVLAQHFKPRAQLEANRNNSCSLSHSPTLTDFLTLLCPDKHQVYPWDTGTHLREHCGIYNVDCCYGITILEAGCMCYLD